MARVSGFGPTGVAAVFLSVTVAVAADRPPRHAPLHEADQAASARLIDVPYLSQTEALCGGAALAMVLRYWGERQVYAEDFAGLVDRSAAGIRTDVLAAAARGRGWQAFPFTAPATSSGEWIQQHVDRGRPVVALIEERPGTYHYVVVVGWIGDRVIAHDPARAPFRVMSQAEFARAWAPAGHWALLLLPPEGRLERDVPSSPAAAEPARALGMCAGLVQASILRARTGDIRAAEDGLRAAIVVCPEDASPWRELAGLRFLESRWAEASRFAEQAGRLGSTGGDDPHTWELLGTSRFLNESLDAALDAWNRIDRPHVDIVNVEGGERTRRPIIEGLLDLAPRTLLTANLFRRTRHRLQQLPAAATTSVSYRPIENGLAEVDATIDERPTVPLGLVPLAAAAGRAWLLREMRIDIAGATGSGELWSGVWRWWDARPKIAFTLAVPAPGRLPGVAMLEASWERQSYRAPIGTADGMTGGHRNDRRRAAVSFTDWATGNLRWEAGGALDRWGDDSHLSAAAALDLRLASDRLSLGVEAAGWIPLQPGRGFVRASLSSAWRSAPDTIGPSWSASTGLTVASRTAPFDLWPGAGTGHARAPLLRAHPLLHNGVVEGPVFGRRLAHASAEYHKPLRAGVWGRLHLAAFADAAQAWQHIDGRRASLLHVDVGAGLRVAAPGLGGTVRMDVARGLRDGRVVFSTGWHGPWPR